MSRSNGQNPMERQLEVISQIIEAGCVVEVGEHEIRLIPPARSTIAHLHGAAKDADNPTAEETERFSMHNMAVESVKACIPGLKRDGAEGLVALAGGEYGDLAEKAMQLCGLQFVFDFARVKVDEALDTTPKTTTLTEAANRGGEVDPTFA